MILTGCCCQCQVDSCIAGLGLFHSSTASPTTTGGLSTFAEKADIASKQQELMINYRNSHLTYAHITKWCCRPVVLHIAPSCWTWPLPAACSSWPRPVCPGTIKCSTMCGCAIIILVDLLVQCDCQLTIGQYIFLFENGFFCYTRSWSFVTSVHPTDPSSHRRHSIKCGKTGKRSSSGQFIKLQFLSLYLTLDGCVVVEFERYRVEEGKEDITQCTYYVYGMSLLIHRGNVPSLPSYLGYAI